MALNIVVNPYEYFNDPDEGRPIFNGDIYVGEIDLDPEIPANQKQVSAKQEDGSIIPIAQPISTNSGGNPTYDGSPVVLLVDGNYSIKVLDKQGQQEFYQANVNNGAPATKDEVYLVYDTVADATADISLSVGDAVSTLGYANANDGGAGNYVVVAGGTGTDDGGSYHDMTNGNQLELIIEGAIAKAAQWGAFADGNPLGTTANGTDNGVRLQAAIDYLFNTYYTESFASSGSLIIDAGTYETTTGISVPPNFSIIGKGRDLTEFQNQAGNTVAFNMIEMVDRGVDGGEKVNRNLTLQGFSINGNDNNTTGNVKNLVVNNAIYCSFVDMEFKQSEDINVELNSCSNFQYSSVLLRDGNQDQLILNDCANMTFGSSVTIRTGSGWGVRFPSTSTQESQRITFSGCRFSTSRKGGILCEDTSSGISVLSCSFVEGGFQTETNPAAIRVESGDADGWQVSSNDFTRIFGDAIYMGGDAAVISDNRIWSCRYNGIVAVGIDALVRGNTVIDSGYFMDNTYDGIRADGARAVVVENRVFFKNDVSGVGNIPRYAINMDVGAVGNSECYQNTIGTGAAHIPLNIVQSSTITYKNKGAPAQVAFVYATMSADQVVGNGATTTIDFDTIVKDVQGDFDTATNTFTCPADGFYHINLTVDAEAVNAASTLVSAKFINSNTSVALFNIQPNNYEGTLPVQGKIFMNEGDLGRAQVQFAGGDGTVNDRCYLQIERADI